LRVLLFVVLCACGRIGFANEVDAAAATDTVATGDAVDPLVVNPPFSVPVPVTELNSTDFEDDPTLSTDQLEILFTSTRPGGVGLTDLWAATRMTATAAWGTPSNVAELNTAANESNPELSSDGLTLVFSRGGAGDQDLYLATRSSPLAAWGPATRIDELSIVGAHDFAASRTAAGDAIYFSSNRTTGNLELYTSTRAAGMWSTPTPIAELAAPGTDTGPHVMLAGNVVWFASDRTGTSGAQDIWVAINDGPGTPFSTVVHVVELATADDDTDPCLSVDGRAIYFARTDASGTNIYMATR
jgi:hypothetical protein